VLERPVRQRQRYRHPDLQQIDRLAVVPDLRLAPLLVSPLVGSLLGVLAMRLPEGRPVVLARSECDHCHARLRPWELVPIVSYLACRGRCRRCGTRIGLAHLLVELAAPAIALVATLAATLVYRDPDPAWLWSACMLGWCALVLGWIDWTHQRLPDSLTLPLLLAGLLSTWLRDPAALGLHALACVAGYLAFRLIALAYRLLRGRDGLGAGDAKLLAAGGAWLGLAPLPWMVLAGSIATLFLAVATGRVRGGDAVPFGPGLAAALWVLFLCAGEPA
jgi:leader peptidase (prepilin peptidase)/N-methyltransferase